MGWRPGQHQSRKFPRAVDPTVSAKSERIVRIWLRTRSRCLSFDSIPLSGKNTLHTLVHCRLTWLFLVAAVIGNGGLFSQVAEHTDNGIPFYSVYNLEELGLGLSSFRLYEDDLGRILAYEDGNIFVYDGRSWTPLSGGHAGNHGIVVAMESGTDGKIYAGTVSNWGYLEPTVTGNYQFVPLSDDVEDISWTSANRFNHIIPYEHGAVFIGELAVVRYDSRKGNHVWRWLNNPTGGFTLNEQIYITTEWEGVYRIEGDQMVRVDSLKGFQGDLALFHQVQMREDAVILATRNGGIFRFDGVEMTPVVTEIDGLLKKGIVAMCRVGDGYVAVAVKGEGLFFLDESLRVITSIRREVDSSFIMVRDLFYQEEGILWVSIPDGIAKVYFPSQLSLLDQRMGLFLDWPKIQRFDGVLHIITDGNINRAQYDENGRLEGFEPIRIPGNPVLRCAAKVANGVLFGSKDGIGFFDETQGTVTMLQPELSGNMFFFPSKYPDRAVVLGIDFNVLLERDGSGWRVVGEKQPSAGYSCVSIESPQGEIWVEHGLGRISRIEILDDGIRVNDIRNIPGIDEAWINVWIDQGEVYISTSMSTARYNPETKSFEAGKRPEWLTESVLSGMARPMRDMDGSIWIPSFGQIYKLRPDGNGGYKTDFETLRLIKENNQQVILEEDGSAFIFSRSRVIRYDPGIRTPGVSPRSPVISEIRVSNSDQVIQTAMRSDPATGLILPYSQNGLNFRMFTPAYSLSKPPSYSYFLENYSKSWSQPSQENTVSFTNLFEGSYCFRVRLLDAKGMPQGETSFSFTIQPPFYRTHWAYLAYAVGALALVFGVVKAVMVRSERERARLEWLVKARTEELDHANAELQVAVVEAQKANEAKGQFLASMSHEIRTPMNGVVGMADMLIETPLSSEQRELVEIINKSGNVLLSVINDILDYSKIEAGKIDFESIRFLPSDLVDDVLDILGSKANAKAIEFFSDIRPEVPHAVEGDVTRIRQVLVNLVSNAIKFTTSGEVEIRVSSTDGPAGRVMVKFAVRDTGIGISQDKMSRLFNSFSQLDASDSRLYGGTGLGLAISKRLVELMGGRIQVESEERKGSCFSFSIPLCLVPQDSEVVQTPPPLQGQRLLYVDYCARRRQVVSEWLSSRGSEVVAVGDVENALALLHGADRFDTVLVDSIPGVFAWRKIADELAGHFRMRPPNLLAFRYPLEKVEHSFVTASLSKPFKQRQLVQVIESIGSAEDYSSAALSEMSESRLRSLGVRQPLSILLVEDNRVNQQVVSHMLRRMSYPCDVVASGEDALAGLQTRCYDLVLMDLQLPGMDGFETARRIRKDIPSEKQPRIIALTAGSMAGDYDHTVEAGMDGFLIKPLRIEDFSHQLRETYVKLQLQRSAE